MSRSVYNYTVEILKKVSFNPKLFKKELVKASKRLLPHEYSELMIWVKNYTFQAFYSELHTFCSSDLSAFYFDIRKDSLYCDALNDDKRRATRTVLNEVFKCLTTWLAPVISYTAEEAWLAHIGSDNEDSIHFMLVGYFKNNKMITLFENNNLPTQIYKLYKNI